MRTDRRTYRTRSALRREKSRARAIRQRTAILVVLLLAGAWLWGMALNSPRDVATPLWAVDIGSEISVAPAFADTCIYVSGADGDLRKLDNLTGRLEWLFSSDFPLTSTAGLVHGRVFVGSEDGVVYAVDGATGKLRWVMKVGATVVSSSAGEASTTATPLKVVDYSTAPGNELTPDAATVRKEALGHVYVGTDDGYVYATESITGKLMWKLKAGGAVAPSLRIASVEPVGQQPLLIFGASDSRVYALESATGARRWFFQTHGAVLSPCTVHGRTVFVGSDDQNVYALNVTTGRRVWEVQTGGIVRCGSVADSDAVYIGSNDGILRALGCTTGYERWRHSLGDEIHCDPVLYANTVLCGADNGLVCGIDRDTGERLWQYDAGGPIRGIGIVSDGLVCLVTGNGRVIALQVP